MNLNKKQFYDETTDTSWIVFKSGPEGSYEELAPGINVEYNDSYEVIGLEIQNYSRLFESKPTTEKRDEAYFYQNISQGEKVSNFNAYFQSGI